MILSTHYSIGFELELRGPLFVISIKENTLIKRQVFTYWNQQYYQIKDFTLVILLQVKLIFNEKKPAKTTIKKDI